jgi:hypothetical protein
VEQDEPRGPYENIEILVRVPAVLGMTAKNNRSDALKRAAVVLKEAAAAVAAQMQSEDHPEPH